MDLYSTQELIGLIEETVNTPHAFALNMFFPEPIAQETEEIHFDKLPLDDILAPFVRPELPARSMDQKGFKTETFAPAYIKPMHTVSPSQAMKRRPGESWRNPLTPAQRRDLYVEELLENQLKAIARRKEWMAWQVLLSGSVVVEGEDYPAVTVDFGRDASLTELLTGGDAWDQATADIIGFFDDRATKTQDFTGIASTTHILDPQAWSLARANDKFRETLDIRRQTSGEVELGPYALADGDADAAITSGRYMGSIGDHEFYVFSGKYTDPADNVRKAFLPANTVLSTNPRGFQGRMVHGAIMDHESLQAIEEYPKMWDEDNPSKRQLMTQSAPLPVAGRINQINVATVL